MKNKDKTDKFINAVATIAIITFFVGAIIAIWIGLIGVKILLSAAVLFFADWAVAFRFAEKNKDDKKENERRRRQAREN